MDLKKLLRPEIKTGLVREYDDNYYDKIRVYRSRAVNDLSDSFLFAKNLRGIPGLKIERIFFENLQLRKEEGAMPIEESGDISESLLKSYLDAADIDIVKFVGKFQEKRLEIGIDKRNWEVWLRIWHLTVEELESIEDQLALGKC